MSRKPTSRRVLDALRALADENGMVRATNAELYQAVFGRPLPQRNASDISRALRELADCDAIETMTTGRQIRVLDLGD